MVDVMADPDDSFQFVFNHIDALEAVAEVGRRINLGRAFGWPDYLIRAQGWSPMMMVSCGWCLDPVTETWFPHWWPEWAR